MKDENLKNLIEKVLEVVQKNKDKYDLYNMDKETLSAYADAMSQKFEKPLRHYVIQKVYSIIKEEKLDKFRK